MDVLANVFHWNSAGGVPEELFRTVLNLMNTRYYFLQDRFLILHLFCVLRNHLR